jgi:hypothetical protein
MIEETRDREVLGRSANKGIEGPVIASDSEAIQTKPQLPTPGLDRFALLAMTDTPFIS